MAVERRVTTDRDRPGDPRRNRTRQPRYLNPRSRTLCVEMSPLQLWLGSRGKREHRRRGQRETGNSGHGSKASSGEQGRRGPSSRETESFISTRGQSLRTIYEEPQNYCESESGSESVGSELTLSTVSEPLERAVDFEIRDLVIDASSGQYISGYLAWIHNFITDQQLIPTCGSLTGS